jgi:hypothetical protein
MGHLLKIKCVDSRVNVHILSSTRAPFTLTTVQVPNLPLTHTKRITVKGAEGMIRNWERMEVERKISNWERKGPERKIRN